MIRCGHCGGLHASVREVRSCSGPTIETPAAVVGSVSRADRSDAVAPAVRSALVLAGHHGNVAGPEELGRNLVVRAGVPSVPAAWAAAPRIVIDAAVLNDPASTLAALRARWLARQRTVIELATTFDEPPVATEHRPLWKISPTFAFELDELWHLVWSNSVDGRTGNPVWRWACEAVALGARAQGAGDVVLPDGTVAWCDGGPLRPPTTEQAVLHRVGIEHGSLRPLGPNHTLADLAPDQLAAVTHPGAAARIIAPAGSGKTRVLTERARLLLHGWGLPPGAVTLVAFNRRAAGEMVERTGDLPGLQIRTLNAIALAIVNGSAPFVRRGPHRKVIDERDVRRLLDGLVTVPRRTNTDPMSSWLDALSAVRLGLRDPSEVEVEFDGDVDGLADVVPRYRELLAERGLLDFDEQIAGAIELLLSDPGARRAAQRACRLLLVDEFQDLTPAHLLLVRLLSGPDGAVFGVGDDDQTIYGYAGATPAWLIDYQRVFAGSGDHPLTINYRCPPAVVEAAATLLTHNRRRVDKQLAPAPGREHRHGDLTVELVADPVATTVAVAREAARDHAPGQVAVITRVTASLAPIQLALAHSGVPTTAAVDERWLDRTGLAAALAWLRLSLDPGRLAGRDLELAVRRPPRSLSAKVVTWIGEQRSVGGLRRLASRLSGRDGERIEVFAADIERLGAMASGGATTGALLRTLRDDIGLDAAIGALDASRRRLDRSAQIDELDALVSIAELHPEPAGFEEWLRGELRQPGDPDGVVLNTIHSVKGREWPVVIVHDVAAGLMPHRLADDTEEERRVFHVAITRARQRCVVVGPVGHPSPFVRQMTIAGDPNAPAPEPRRRRDATPTPSTALVTITLDAEGMARSDALRAWRADRAKSDRVPAYVVFSNATLDAIAARNPSSLAELARVSGVGATKLERYGDEVLAALTVTPGPVR